MLIGRTDPAGFVERAVYCPPALMEDDSEARFSVAAGERGATVGLQPSDQEELELPPGRMLVDTPAEGSAVDVVGFGTPVEATAFQRTPGGAGATGCSSIAGTRWYFAAGSSALGYDERILVYNPFPEESVVRLSFFTPTGAKVKANLSDIPVRAGTTREISVNEFITLQDELAASVTAVRGRARRVAHVGCGSQGGNQRYRIVFGHDRNVTYLVLPCGRRRERSHRRDLAPQSIGDGGGFDHDLLDY